MFDLEPEALGAGDTLRTEDDQPVAIRRKGDTGGVPEPIGFIFPSRSGGLGHVVILLDTDPPAVACTCPAMRNVGSRPRGCWAMQRARDLLDLPQPGTTG